MKFQELTEQLKHTQHSWLITGVAGFIGSNLLEFLLKNNQLVLGVDNFSTGYQHNLDHVEKGVGSKNWANFEFKEGDIRDSELLKPYISGETYVLHQAALGSVPRSINDPLTTNSVNVDGFLNVLKACSDAKAKAFVYAASSSTYGDHPDLPKKEDVTGNPLSPYAVSKLVNELYADVFYRCYGFGSVGLRYFNVFGKRQNPSGAYAAVIPLWINSAIKGENIYINGDGTTSRDFCFIENVIQANILAAMRPKTGSTVYNVAFGEQTSLLRLANLVSQIVDNKNTTIEFRDFRAGDVKHSLAEITKIKAELHYKPEYSMLSGLNETIEWYQSEL
tara:strand:- start:9601 stop:10602 length:1002 start_codon:yes stop_codon:yes gene_type:complete